MRRKLILGLLSLTVTGACLAMTGASAQASVECSTQAIVTEAHYGPITMDDTNGATIAVYLNAKVDSRTHAYCGTMWAYAAYNHGSFPHTATITASLFWGSTPSSVWTVRTNPRNPVFTTKTVSGNTGAFFDSPLQAAACGVAEVTITIDGVTWGPFDSSLTGVCPG
jgi:hypothetical protein